MSTLQLFFEWPTGGVYSNLLASIIWAVPAFFYARFHIKKIHRKQNELHAKVKLMHKHIKEVHKYLGENNYER